MHAAGYRGGKILPKRDVFLWCNSFKWPGRIVPDGNFTQAKIFRKSNWHHHNLYGNAMPRDEQMMVSFYPLNTI